MTAARSRTSKDVECMTIIIGYFFFSVVFGHLVASRAVDVFCLVVFDLVVLFPLSFPMQASAFGGRFLCVCTSFWRIFTLLFSFFSVFSILFHSHFPIFLFYLCFFISFLYYLLSYFFQLIYNFSTLFPPFFPFSALSAIYFLFSFLPLSSDKQFTIMQMYTLYICQFISILIHAVVSII